MTKNDNIHIKLEICKDENSRELKIMTHFNSNAPNFFKDENSFLWAPTLEEKDFINEAFDLMPAGRMPTSPPKNINPEPPTPEIPETPDVPSPEEKVVEKPRIPPSPFGNGPEEERTSTPDLPPLEETIQDKPPVSESPEEETKNENVDIDKKEEDVFVEADDVAIDEALKKHGEDDNSMVEADESTIIEKVLSQKKKGRWSKE